MTDTLTKQTADEISRKKFPNFFRLVDVNKISPFTTTLQTSVSAKTTRGAHRIVSAGRGYFTFFCTVCNRTKEGDLNIANLTIIPGGLEEILADLPTINDEDTRLIEFLCGILFLAAKQDML